MILYKYPDIRRFLQSLTIILLTIIFCDFVIGRGMEYLYSKQKSGLLYRTTYSIDSTTADYIALGSSRANHHYDPKVFEAVLGTSFYNCGRDAQGVLFSCALAAAIINRYNPKGIIIDILPDEFTRSEEGKLSSLLPYYKNEAVRPYLGFNGKFQNVKLLSHIYPYNSLFTNLIVGLNNKHDEDYKGYVELNTVNTNDRMITLSEPNPPDSGKIKAFYKLVGELEQRHIPVLIIISPVYATNINSVTPEVCLNVAKKNKNVRFLNFMNVKYWQRQDLFSADEFHLNKAGAIVFSEAIAKIIAENPPGKIE